MDEDFMAPPFKRRKLSSSMPHSVLYQDNSTATPEALLSFAHAVKSLYEYSPLAVSSTATQSTEGVQTWIARPAYGGIEDFKVLSPRQGTSASSSVEESSSVSSVVSPTSYAGSTDSSPDSSPTVPFTSITSASVPADTVPAGVSKSDASTKSSSSVVSSSVSSSSSNDTSSITSSASLSTSTTLSSSSLNLTTSAIIFVGESITSTSKTTITLGASSSSSTDTAFFFLATLSNGDVSTISQSSDAYTTTFPDGDVLTVPAKSSRSSERTSSTSDSTSDSTSTALQTTSLTHSSAGRTTVTSIATVGVAGGASGGGQGYNSPVSSSAPSSTGHVSSENESNSNNNNNPPAGTIAGGVVGGAAGLAVVVLIAMLLVRWYRRKAQIGHRALPPGSATSPETDPPADSYSQGPGMAERAGILPFVAAVPALFRHQNRSAEGSGPTERGFTRVSGRKLPSAFSEGMSSPPPPPPPGMSLSNSPPDERNLSSTSFYRDSNGFYGGDGRAASDRSATSPASPTSPSSSAPIRNSAHEMMTMSPGPQRQPQLHTGGPYVLSPTSSDVPTSPPGTAATFGRSDTPSSLRNSRFTEDM